MAAATAGARPHHRGAADRDGASTRGEGGVRRPGRRRALRRDAVSRRGPSAAAATALGMATRPPASLARQQSAAASRLAGVRGRRPSWRCCRPACTTRVRRRRDPGRYAPAWLRPGLARQYRDTHDPWRWKRLDGPRWWASLADTLTRGRETADIADYLRRRGRMGGLEARSPLLDLRLVELALRIPPETSFDPVTSRPLVREALRGALPPEVLARKDKRDFAAMQHETLQRTENLEWARRLLDERSAAVGAYVDLRATASRSPRSAARGRRARAGGRGR